MKLKLKIRGRQTRLCDIFAIYLLDSSRRKKRKIKKSFTRGCISATIQVSWNNGLIYCKSIFAVRSQDLQDPKTFIWTGFDLIYVTVTQIEKHRLWMPTHKLKK